MATRRIGRGLGMLTLVVAMLVAASAHAAEPAPAEPAAAAPDGAAAKSLIDARYGDIDTIISSGAELEAMRKRITELTETFVDFDELSRLTIKKHWEGLGAEKQAEFVGLFKQLIQRTYARRFKPDRKLTVTFDGDTEIRKGKARVRTTIRSGDITAAVEYRLHVPAGKAEWWVYDIVIDEVSQMRNYRSQFGKIIKADGVDGLFAKLREKVEKGEE